MVNQFLATIFTLREASTKYAFVVVWPAELAPILQLSAGLDD
jgi:hypothetical protein